MSEQPNTNLNQESQPVNSESQQIPDEQTAQRIEQIASKPEDERTPDEIAILDAFEHGAQSAIEASTPSPKETTSDESSVISAEKETKEQKSDSQRDLERLSQITGRPVDDPDLLKLNLRIKAERFAQLTAAYDAQAGTVRQEGFMQDLATAKRELEEAMYLYDPKFAEMDEQEARTKALYERTTDPEEKAKLRQELFRLRDHGSVGDGNEERPGGTPRRDAADQLAGRIADIARSLDGSEILATYQLNSLQYPEEPINSRRRTDTKDWRGKPEFENGVYVGSSPERTGEWVLEPKAPIAPKGEVKTGESPEAVSEEPSQPSSEEAQSTDAEVVSENEEESDFEFVAVKSTDLAKEIDRLAGIISDRDRDAYKDKKGLKKVLSIVWRKGFKHNTWFEPETKRRIASKLLEQLGENKDLSNLTQEDIDKLYAENGLEPPRRQEQEMLAMVADGVFGPNGALGKKISGEGQNDSPEIAQLRGGLKDLVLEYVSNHSVAGLTDEQRGSLTVDYQARLSELVSEFMKSNPNFSQEMIAQLANNGAELLSRAVATSRHEEGMDRLTAQLETMRIDVGEVQTGSYNNADTKYLERTIALQRKRNTARILGKSAVLAGSWAAAVVVASTLSKGAAETLTSSGATRVATLGAAFAVGGPIAALATTVGMAYVVGKVRGEKAQGRDEDLRGVESAYGTKSAEGLEGHSDELETYEEASASLMPYMKLRPGVDPDSATARDYELRDDLTQEELVQYGTTLARLTAKLDTEARYNEESATIAEEQTRRNRGFRGGVRNALRGRTNPDARAYAVFSANSREDYMTERNDLLRLVAAGSTGLNEHYRDTELTQDDLSIKLEEFVGAIYTQERVTTESEISQLQRESDTRIKDAGKKAGKVAAIAAASLAVGGAAVAETITSGRARTIFDVFGARPNSSEAVAAMSGTHVVKGNTELISETNYGSSAANIKDGVLSVTNPNGQTVKVPVLPDGSLAPESIRKLADAGVEATQTVGTTKSVGMADFMTQNGGKRASRIEVWLNNNTRKYDGTELGLRRYNDNGILRWSQDYGTARNGSTVVDLAQAGAKGQVSIEFVSGNTSIRVPLVPKDGKLVVDFLADDPLRKLFTPGGNYRGDMVHTLVTDSTGRTMSVASYPGLAQDSVQTASRTLIELTQTPPVAPSTGYTLNGLVPTPVRRQFETPDSSTQSQPENSNQSEMPNTNIQAPVNPSNQQNSIETQETSSVVNPESADSVQVEPLSPQEITERLQEPDKMGTQLTIKDERMEIKSANQGNITMSVVDGPRSGQEITMSSADMTENINNGSVMIEDFLGASNPEEIVSDLKDGEILFDKELGGYVKIQRNGDSFTYVELDDNRVEIPNQKPRSYIRQALEYRLSHGLIRPLQYRGIKTL